MSDYSIKSIREMEGYYLGSMKRARAELGVSSFGLQVLQMPPNITAYPEHDHAGSGQEEVYIPIAGSGEIELDGERHPLTEGMMVRVGPTVKRKIWPGDEGIRLIAIGGVPGKPYEVPSVTELGAPDPMAG